MELADLITFHERTNLAVIIDPQLSSSMGQLRALPLLLKLGVEKYSTIPEWGKPCQQLLPKSCYTKYHENLTADYLAVFTSEKLERKHSFTASLFLDKISSREIEKCIFIVDRDNFRVRRSARPLAHNATQYNFKELYSIFSQFFEEKGISFPLKDTYNVFLQETAHNLKTKLKREFSFSYEIFIFNERTVDESIWDWLICISKEYEENPGRGFRTIAFNHLRPMVENASSLRKIVKKIEDAYSKQFRQSYKYIIQERKALRALI